MLIENVKSYNIAEIEKYIGIINSSAKNTFILLDNLLNWAKSQTGQISFNQKNLNLSSIIQETLDISISTAKANTIAHKKFNVSKGQRTVDKVYHVQNVNNMDMRLRKFMDSFNGVATKYLQNYLNWFLVLEKIKNSTSKIPTINAIAFVSNTVWFEYKQQLFNMLIRT